MNQTFLLHQIIVALSHDMQTVKNAIVKKTGIHYESIADIQIIRRSLDVRPIRKEPVYVISAYITVLSEKEARKLHKQHDALLIENKRQQETSVIKAGESKKKQIYVIGAGPAGLMGAFLLAEAGYKPVIIERGAPAEDRCSAVKAFWTKGTFDSENNVLFGEGGAGLFSDGKLTSRTKDRAAMRQFFKILISCGAPESIAIDSDPHLGSDVLIRLIPLLREKIEKMGGQFKFYHRFEGCIVDKERLCGILVNGKQYETDRCILATGHSARDAYEVLAQQSGTLEAKPFAIGVRLEMPQKKINKAQWGRFSSHPLLGAASFRLTRKAEKNTRACYSFCMCPGGTVIACASEPGYVTTNGMSNMKRDTNFANAAFIVPVTIQDVPFESEGALAGIALQRSIESKAFHMGGRNYSLPAMSLENFLQGREPRSLPNERSCVRASCAPVYELFPSDIYGTLKQAIPQMLSKLSGITREDVLVYAAETRSSAPVRIIRDINRESIKIKGLFPAGEGSGYAGGIVSSALDGMKSAHALAASYTR